jgi:hypothetical protein
VKECSLQDDEQVDRTVSNGDPKRGNVWVFCRSLSSSDPFLFWIGVLILDIALWLNSLSMIDEPVNA